MKAVILAAGGGTRMRPLTDTRPKPMLPLANKPLLEHLLLEAKEADIAEFIFVVGHHAHRVRDYFGDGERWGVSIEYVTQKKHLGTAYALRLVEGAAGDRFLALNGDVIVKKRDIGKMTARDGISLGIIEVEDPQGLGVVEIAGDRIVGLYEKVASPPSNLANTGIYLLTEDIFHAISRIRRSPRGEYEITDCLQLLIDDGYPIRYEKLDYWLDLNYPWNLLAANETLLRGVKSQNSGMIEQGVVIKGSVSVGRGTTIRANSYIVGPVAIGENCEIGPNAYIRPATSIGDGCHIGSGVEIKRSIIMGGTKVPHHNYVGDSVIGEDCNLGAGTQIANLRLDKKAIEVMGINTQLQKLGAILGDGVQTGINACINVGSLIGSNTYIGPGAVASGVILPHSKIL